MTQGRSGKLDSHTLWLMVDIMKSCVVTDDLPVSTYTFASQ